MLTLSVAFLLSQLPPVSEAQRLPLFVAVNSERASGFRSLAQCENALTGRDGARGTRFNRAAGNISRCEMVAGEAVIVVYPKGLGAPPRP